MKQRNTTIDFLRGVAIIAMIFIHTSYFFISNHAVEIAWNYAQFAVPVFVYCSAYLAFNGKSSAFNFGYLKKRFIRLLRPYYIFLIFFIPLIWVQNHSTISVSYIVRSIFVWSGGVDISWLVLLFLQLALVMPFVAWSFAKQKFLFWIFCLASLASSILFIFYKLSYDWRFIAWLPWSTILGFTIYAIRFRKNRMLRYGAFIVSSILFIVLTVLFTRAGHSVSLYDNKYPPTAYYLLFGIIGVFGFTFIEKITIQTIKKAIHFFSIYSYSIFFIHYWILTAIQPYIRQWHFTWWSLFGGVLILTTGVQLFIRILYRVRRAGSVLN